MWNVIVIDGTGHTFGLTYRAKSAVEAKAQFRARLKRLGKKVKRVKIVDCYKVS